MNNSTGVNRIPNRPSTLTYETIDYFKFNKKSKHIVIPNHVTLIGGAIFKRFYNLTTITIPNSVVKIENYTFDGCRNLTSVDIQGSITRIGRYAFNSCVSLTSIDIPRSVTDIGQTAFAGCSRLKSIIIPHGIKEIKLFTFIDCKEMRYADIPPSVTDIGEQAFTDCTSLSSIVIPSSITTMGWRVFHGCTDLQFIIIPSALEEKGTDFWTHIGIHREKTALVTESMLSTWANRNSIPSSYSYHELAILYKLQKDNNFIPSWSEISKIAPNVGIRDLLKVVPEEKKSTMLPKILEDLQANRGVPRLSLFSFAPVAFKDGQEIVYPRSEDVNEYRRSNEPEKTLFLKDMCNDTSKELLQWLTLKEIATILRVKATSDIKRVNNIDETAGEEGIQCVYSTMHCKMHAVS